MSTAPVLKKSEKPSADLKLVKKPEDSPSYAKALFHGKILSDRLIPYPKANEEEEDTIKASTVISILDEISNDPNIPIHARTLIWNVLSELESVRE